MAPPEPLHPDHSTTRLIGQSLAIQTLRMQIAQLAAFDTLGNPAVPTVLLQGETGTGKGLVARVIHESGPRAKGPFIEINCAALPETLLEAELFGYEAGAFTDAKRAKLGLFEAASGGVLFLDEIDVLPLPLQGKLLTAIEAKRVRRVGAVRETAVDVKLIAATQAALQAYMETGRFRADLYHRLAVIVLSMPPLRDRGRDVLVLARHFLQRYAAAYGVAPKRLSRAAEAWLQRYAWPGNVRELSHLLERVILFHAAATVDRRQLEELCLRPQPVAADAAEGQRPDAPAASDEADRIRQALHRTGGNLMRAARLLGFSRKAMRYRVHRYGIDRSPQSPINRASADCRGESPGPPTSVRPAEQEGGHPSPPAAEPGPPGGMPASGSLTSRAEPRGWEQKPVAVLAIELTWPERATTKGPRYEPWTVSTRWEATIVEKVHGFGGVVLQRSPSLLLVAFGIPQTLEQLPQRAVQAALTLRTLVAEGGDGGPCPALRQAAHWGQVLVDGGANDPTARLLPIGEALALPVRLLGQCMLGEIVVSAPVGRLIEGWFALESQAGPAGQRHPDQSGASVVVGLRPQPSPLRLQGPWPLSPFVGRAREFAVLEDLLGQAQEGRGQVVGVIGEPGIGKSRLCDEFIRRPRLRGWQIRATSTTAYGQATPYLPVIGLLKAYFQLEEQDALTTRREKITAKLQTLGAVFEPSLPAVLSLLEVPVEAPAWQALDPPHRRQRTLEALTRLLLWESQVQPLLLVVENLHWIDGETQAWLETLIDSLPAARLLLLVSYRPEYQHAWGSKTAYTQLRLDPLAAPHAQTLLGSLLGADPSLRPLIPRVIAQTEGNPFFLEESVRTLVETHVLAGAPGAYRLAQAVEHIQVPATVHLVLAARIDRLPPEAKRLLQTAAVIGKEVPLALLQAIAECREEPLRLGLAHLQAAEFLYETRLFPEIEYTFTHALTQQVAYESLLQERRRALHARIVEALERLYPEQLPEHVERLAHHAFRGEVWAKAVPYCRQAGAKAAAYSANREAVTWFERALAALKHLPEGRDIIEQAIDLRFALRDSLFQLGEFGQIFDYLHEAGTLAEALGDHRRLARISAYMAANFHALGDPDRARDSAQHALAIAVALGNFTLQLGPNFYLGLAHCSLGDYHRAIDCFRQAVAFFASTGRRERLGWLAILSVTSRTWLVWCLAEVGAFTEGIAHAEEVVRMAETADHLYSRIQAYHAGGFLYLRKGDLQQAVRALERGLELCQVADIPIWFPWTASALGAAYALSGRITEALPLLEQAMEQGASGRMIAHRSRSLSWLSEAYLLAGRLDDAMCFAMRALDLSHKHKEQGHQAWILQLLGKIYSHRDPSDVETAEAHYRQALALANDLGMRPLQAHCHRCLGTIYATIGRQEQTRAELSAAIVLYRAMDMTFWLPQAEAALAQVEGRP
jgi:DNA-binding NtrC family response regulator/tetratricopeptide (TPR) repeat protein